MKSRKENENNAIVPVSTVGAVAGAVGGGMAGVSLANAHLPNVASSLVAAYLRYNLKTDLCFFGRVSQQYFSNRTIRYASTYTAPYSPYVGGTLGAFAGGLLGLLAAGEVCMLIYAGYQRLTKSLTESTEQAAELKPENDDENREAGMILLHSGRPGDDFVLVNLADLQDNEPQDRMTIEVLDSDDEEEDTVVISSRPQ